MPRPAVFLDRDGTVTEEVGYVNHVDRLRLLPSSGPAIRRLNQHAVPAVLVTNQAGVARGYFPIRLIDLVHQRLAELLAAAGAHLDGLYYSPFVKGGAEPPYNVPHHWRKPETGMIEQAARDLDLDLSRSFAVGDKITDVEMIQRVGGKGIFVLTGYGKGDWEYQRHLWKSKPDFVAADLAEAVDWILREIGA
ncbi:MAG: HAD-IIIA family hydrolase [Myxococcales bacterium]|nr:HAD-IIIA family hydrolase [Myxococcales bacterium]